MKCLVFVTRLRIRIPAGGWHGTDGNYRLGPGAEDNGNDFLSAGETDHLVASRGNHGHQRTNPPRWGPLETVQQVLRLYREAYFNLQRAPLPPEGARAKQHFAQQKAEILALQPQCL